jgi:hypothetical protein
MRIYITPNRYEININKYLFILYNLNINQQCLKYYYFKERAAG